MFTTVAKGCDHKACKKVHIVDVIKVSLNMREIFILQISPLAQKFRGLLTNKDHSESSYFKGFYCEKNLPCINYINISLYVLHLYIQYIDI